MSTTISGAPFDGRDEARILIATPYPGQSGWSERDISVLNFDLENGNAAWLMQDLYDKFATPTYTKIETAGDAYKASAVGSRARGRDEVFTAWADYVATGVDSWGAPNFDIVLVPTENFPGYGKELLVAKGTAMIIGFCLDAGKPVYELVKRECEEIDGVNLFYRLGRKIVGMDVLLKDSKDVNYVKFARIVLE